MTKKILIVVGVVIAFYALLIAMGQAKNPFSSNGSSGTRIGDDSTEDGTLKCELRGNDGRIITITGKGPEFEKLCKSQNQPVTLYGYQYYPLYYYQWYHPWGWRRWSGGGGGGGATGATGA